MLQLESVTKIFHPGTPDARTALQDLTLHAKKGDFITVIGPNGAGKSTLFNAICGSFTVDSGRILLDGQDITLAPEYCRARTIGRLFQDPLRGTAPTMTIAENLALAAGRGGWFGHITGADRKDFRERLALLNMGLEERLDSPVGLLSGGQRQALTLLMATVNPPKLLLLDEHTAALDPAAGEQVLNLTRSIVRAQGLTCLMVTHNMRSALALGSRTIMLEGGRILLDTEGRERERLTVNDLLEKFREARGQTLDNDRMLLI